METARNQLADLAAGNPSGFIFTSGGTEANNTALLEFDTVITCITEHDAILAARPDAKVPRRGHAPEDALRESPRTPLRRLQRFSGAAAICG